MYSLWEAHTSRIYSKPRTKNPSNRAIASLRSWYNPRARYISLIPQSRACLIITISTRDSRAQCKCKHALSPNIVYLYLLYPQCVPPHTTTPPTIMRRDARLAISLNPCWEFGARAARDICVMYVVLAYTQLNRPLGRRRARKKNTQRHNSCTRETRSASQQQFGNKIYFIAGWTRRPV